MGDYIRREPAILAINMAMDKFPYAKDPQRPETYSKYNEGWTDACDYILGMIEAENTADVAPVVHGRWIDKGWDGDFSWRIDGRGNCWKVIACSACSENLCGSSKTAYCPHCGAKMDLSDGEA